MAHLLTRLDAALERFARQGFGAFAAEYARHDLLRGHPVCVHAAAGKQDGTAAGVDERGALLVRHGSTIARYDSAEVTVRRA